MSTDDTIDARGPATEPRFAVSRTPAGFVIDTIDVARLVGHELRATVTEDRAVPEAQSLMTAAIAELLAKPARSEMWWSTAHFRRIRWALADRCFVGEELDHGGLRPTIQRAAAELGAQRWVCARYDAPFDPITDEALVAVAPRVLRSEVGVEGTRYRPSGANSGWILIDEDFTGGVADLRHEHAAHVVEAKPRLARYFALPPGWRFYSTVDGENLSQVEIDEDGDSTLRTQSTGR